MSHRSTEIQFTNFFLGGGKKREELLAEPADIPCTGCATSCFAFPCLTCDDYICDCNLGVCECTAPFVLSVAGLIAQQLVTGPLVSNANADAAFDSAMASFTAQYYAYLASVAASDTAVHDFNNSTLV